MLLRKNKDVYEVLVNSSECWSRILEMFVFFPGEFPPPVYKTLHPFSKRGAHPHSREVHTQGKEAVP